MPSAAGPQWAMMLLALSLVIASGCRPEAKPSPPASQISEVTVVTPERRALTLSSTQPARIDAFERTPLFPKIAGYVEEVRVDIGDAVKKDDVLVRIAVPELVDELHEKDALLAQAAAEVRQAESLIMASRAAAATVQAKIEEAEAGLIRARADVERWRSEHERIRDLATKGAITRKLDDETLSALRSAEAAVQEATARALSARAGFAEAEARIGSSESDKYAAEARHKVAAAVLERVKTMLGYTEIKAPYDGTVTRRTVDTGHFVQPNSGGGSDPVMEVARTDTVRIFVDVPELEAGHVTVGDAAEVRVQAAGAEIIHAAVTRMSGALLDTNHSLRVEIDIPNPDGILRSGMYATVTIRLEERPEAIVVPVSAIARDGVATFCCVVRDGKVERRPIELGLRSGAFVEVRSGLDETAPIVLRQPELFRDGQDVRIASPR
ncbi:MAG: efflux RND transporter periplasmic adaptor subunit [Planctomycetia bacterium]